jgi:hypothetical protein
MFYRKSLNPSAPKRTTIKIPALFGPDNQTADSRLPGDTARIAYNYNLSDGTLKTGLGMKRAVMYDVSSDMEEYQLPSRDAEIMQLFIYKRFDETTGLPDDRVITRDANGYFYDASLYKNAAATRIVAPRTMGYMDFLNYRFDGHDMLLLSLDSGLYMYDGSATTPTIISDAPLVKSICLHSGRIYASLKGDSTAVWFSDTFDPFNWNVSLDEGGYIEFADGGGYVRRVVQFNDSVYIFRDYSVERLIAYGEQREFSVSNVCVLPSKIIPDTVAHCGDFLTFMLRDGLYTFDGANMKKIFAYVTDMIDKDGGLMRACFHRNKYYLTAKADFQDGKDIMIETVTTTAYKNALFEFDLRRAVVNIMRGVCINDVAAVNVVTTDKVFVAARHMPDGIYKGYIFELNYGGNAYGVDMPMFWESAYNAAASPGVRKLLRSVSFLTKYNTRLVVNADGKKYRYEVKGRDAPSTVNVRKACKMFSIAFESEGEAEIKDVVLELDYV